MLLKTKYGLIAFLILASQVQAQVLSDTSYQLKDVQIQANRFETFNAGIKTTYVDSLSQIIFRQQSLSDLLAQQSSVFVKTYGVGNISTAAFRGTNPEHTAVMWNGFNLQSGMLGLADLSLMPIDFTDDVQIEHGGNGMLFGSGAVGGAIRLQSEAKFESGVKAGLSLSAGSFGTFREGVRFSYGNKKWFTNTRAFHYKAENNFPFQNTSLPNNPEQVRSNASVASNGVQHENYFLLNKNNQLNIRLWYQTAQRGIPAVMSVPMSVANQFDEAVRTSAEWKREKGKLHTALRVAWFNEQLNYHDAISTIHAYSTLNTIIAEFEMRYQITKTQLLLFALTDTRVSGVQDNYIGEKNFNRFGAFAAWRYSSLNKKVKTNIGLRQEFPDKKAAPLVPFAGANYRIKKWLDVLGNISASYRYPTLNERFYNPGGNPQLKPEFGWGQEAGVKFSHAKKTFAFVSSLQGYSRMVDNWIVWVSQGLTTSPRNFRKVWSRGAELNFKATKQLHPFTVKLNSSFNYTRTTNHTSELASDNSIGKQLIYIPRISHQHSLSLVRKSFFVQYTHQYNGLRFIATDNTNWLNDYYTGNMALGYSLSAWKIKCTVQLQANNIFNNQYVVLPERPMPGRNFLFTLTFNI